MPKGKEYTEKQIMKMRDEGVLSPGEIENLTRGGVAPGLGKLDNSTRSGMAKGMRESKRQRNLLREQGVYSPSEIQAIEKKGYKYFPDN
tara:strand:- start:218 stop:484 length:267 start_codon:yes stop_codon:yes gene_type:complete